MSKKILATLLIIFSFSFCKAQWVTIPDANFVAFLQTYYPSCMNGNQMNTSCSDIVNEMIVNCSGQNISDLTGIHYFVNLWQLDCSSNQLTFLPELPNSITIVDCSSNQISNFTNLPNSIVTLACSYNNLTSLPPLPTSLYDFGCASNYLTSFPAIPPSLIWLDVSDNNLGGLPPLENVESLGCGHNPSFNLPVLTNNLVALYCQYDNLQSLPALPSNLQYLACHSNNLQSLPNLPNSLIQLHCQNNNLLSLPALPNSLIDLYCPNNDLKSLPQLPPTMTKFEIAYNSEIKCMPVLQNFTGSSSDFDIAGTGITCFPNVIQHTGFISQIDNMPICICTFPSGISTSNITSTSAKVNWSTECCSQFQIQRRITGTTTWSTVTAVATATSKNLTALSPVTTYDIRMRVKCTDGTTYSSWSPIQTFTTLVSCVAPTGITISNLTPIHATINWAAVANAYSYKFSGRKLGTTAWTTYTIIAPLTIKQLNGLTANTTYQYRMQTVCNASGIPTSPWTAISTFSTPLRMEDESMDNATIDFIIYPNPVSQLLTVTSDFSIGDIIEIKDLLGRTIFSKETIEESSNTIDVSNLSAAQYFISIRKNDGSVLIKQFVKE